MNQPTADTGREWNPYELATPVAPAAPQSLTGLSAGPGADARYGIPEPRLAGRVARLLAALVDHAMLMVPVGFAVLAGYGILRRYMLTGEVVLTTGARTGMLLAAVLLVGLVVWNLVLLHQRGQTVGKRVVGIRIVRPDGDDAGLARLVLLRVGLLVVIGAVLTMISPWLEWGFVLANVLFIFTASRRCLHDHIADTIVVTA